MKKIKLSLKLSLFVCMLFMLVSCKENIHITRPDREQKEIEYTVFGVDVSSYQENIDWKTLSENEISFAFIKATEGSGYVDRRFDENISEIQETDIAVGAYHFLSYDSDGISQARNFISKVSPDMIDLPPVIDLEFYGEYVDNPPEFSKVEKILNEMIPEFEKVYGVTPIIYTNLRGYYLYIIGTFDKCDIWMCDLTGKPHLLGGKKWTFWQYSHTEQLPGYSGGEEFIDMSLFNGTEKEFKEYLKKR